MGHGVARALRKEIRTEAARRGAEALWSGRITKPCRSIWRSGQKKSV